MKNSILFWALLATTASFAQGTSFEEPSVFTIQYVDTGDAAVAHDLLNNTDEPYIDYTSTGNEIGFNARYEPYDTPGVGLTDGDFAGVTDVVPTSMDPFPSGAQGYQISDVDGNFILEFDVINSTSTGPSFSISYFISETGYEGDGTLNESGSDRLKIYVKHVDLDDDYIVLDTTGSNINDLGVEGQWIRETIELPSFYDCGHDCNFQVIIEARTNAGSEAFFFDDLSFDLLLGIEDNFENTISISPNPATANYVNIVSPIEGTKEVAVYDVLGKRVINTTMVTDRLDISNLNSGIYIIKIIQGAASATKKLVVR